MACAYLKYLAWSMPSFNPQNFKHLKFYVGKRIHPHSHWSSLSPTLSLGEWIAVKGPNPGAGSSSPHLCPGGAPSQPAFILNTRARVGSKPLEGKRNADLGNDPYSQAKKQLHSLVLEDLQVQQSCRKSGSSRLKSLQRGGPNRILTEPECSSPGASLLGLSSTVCIPTGWVFWSTSVTRGRTSNLLHSW